MQMSALEEHNNSLLHKEALRLQMASKDKTLGLIDRPSFIKGRQGVQYPISGECDLGRQCSTILQRDPHELEFIQAVQEVVHSLQPVLSKMPQYGHSAVLFLFERVS
jgi:glutamate dehydrogenase (NADP+)